MANTKVNPIDKKRRVMLSLSIYQKEQLKSIGEGSLTRGVEMCLEAYLLLDKKPRIDNNIARQGDIEETFSYLRPR